MDDLVTMLNGVYCLSELIEFAAFLKLRWKHPDMHRPYRLPLNLCGCALILIAPTSMCVVLLVLPFWRADWQTAIFVLSSAGLGPVLYAAIALSRRLCPRSFLRSPFEDSREAMIIYEPSDCPNGHS